MLEILRLIATFTDAKACASDVLAHAQAHSAALLLFDEPRWSLGTLPADNAALLALARQLGDGVHLNPAVTFPTTTAVTAAATIRDGKQLLGIAWFGFTATPQADALQRLEAVVFALTAVCVRAHHEDRSTSATKLMDSVLKSIPDPLLILDEAQNISLMNTAAERVFGISAANAIGQPVGSVVTDEPLLTLMKQPDTTLDEWTSAKDETFMPSLRVVKDDHESLGMILVLRDVTRFKRLNRNQNEFVRIVAHDLRSPLTSMQGFTSMMSMVGALNEKQSHFAERILAGISQMTSLVENIQDAGRYDPETGFYEMSRSQCDLTEMVDRIVSTYLIPAEKQELTLTVTKDETVPIVYIDQHMIERAIINLVDNAIKYTPNGGKVDVNLSRADGQLVISIKDSGFGISPENQKHLFERHVRIRRQEHSRVKGSGLGLFIVRSVARQHGGEAWVESVEGQGSAFKIGIPLTADNLQPVAKP
jgi:PAS domain S-box-containing protein